ncbi:hypothetical protein B0H16DRAFT_1484346 [Mycena metata]|uniref:Uncharacterized protein n=1 Tax=Mycena metata TaxID=1033252 RepID=A0AAD7GN55_9AGAR|nr:hypothetical protein B0H16DRAFT_1484346 [Mycena metata]
MSHFPIEIGLNLFTVLLYGATQFNYTTFMRTRWVLCRASCEWMRIINGRPEFWRQIYVDLTTPVELITWFIIKAGMQTIDLCIAIEFLESYETHGGDGIQATAARIDTLRPLIQRARTLLLQVNDRRAFDVIQELLPTIIAPHLTEVVIRFEWSWQRWDYGVSNHGGWHGLNLLDLKRVHLDNTMFPFPFIPGNVLAIHELHLYNLQRDRALDASLLRSIIHMAPQLQSLAIVDVSVRNDNDRLIHSDSITKLHMEFSDGAESVLLAAKLRFPAAHDLTIRLSSNRDVDGMAKCEALLSGITNLAIHDDGRDTYSIGKFADKCTGVTHLNLAHAEATLALLSDFSVDNRRAGRTTVFPALQSVILGGATAEQAVRFCKLHGIGLRAPTSRISLQSVTLVGQSAPRNYHGYMDWLQENVGTFRIQSYVNHVKATEASDLKKLRTTSKLVRTHRQEVADRCKETQPQEWAGGERAPTGRSTKGGAQRQARGLMQILSPPQTHPLRQGTCTKVPGDKKFAVEDDRCQVDVCSKRKIEETVMRRQRSERRGMEEQDSVSGHLPGGGQAKVKFN